MKNNINRIIETILNNFKEGKINKEDALLKIRDIYFEDIGFAKIDHHRALRRGFTEVVYGAGKSPEQILEIAKKILNYSDILLITRTTEAAYNLLKKEIKNIKNIKNIKFNKKSGIIYIPPDIPYNK
ncbi:MAG: hypothetical protein PHC87_04910, partial [Actinomycetota bacterium]|nr:hypothetical protein [Actinomycetota bacterium]